MRARIKGTDIVVDCERIDEISSDHSPGIRCKYLTGEFEGTHETIPGDCLVEMKSNIDWEKLNVSMIIDFVSASIVNLGEIPTDRETRMKMIDSAIELANDLEEKLKNKK